MRIRVMDLLILLATISVSGMLWTTDLAVSNAAGGTQDTTLADARADMESFLVLLARKYYAANISGDVDTMYNLLSSNSKRHVSKASFEQEYHRQCDLYEYTGIAGVCIPRLRNTDLAAVGLDLNVKAHKGRMAGTSGKTMVPLWAERENGEWKILDRGLLPLPLELDIARLADEFTLAWWGIRQLPESISAKPPFELYTESGAIATLSLEKWQAGELIRLSEYGDRALPLAGEYIGRDGKLVLLRCGFQLVTLEGKMLDAAYRICFATLPKAGDSDIQVWKLVSIKPERVQRTKDTPLEVRYKRATDEQIKAILSIADARLKEWVHKKPTGVNDAVRKMINAGHELKSYELGKLQSISDLYSGPEGAHAQVEVTLTYKKESPPSAVSGRQIIEMVQVEKNDGRELSWAIGGIHAERQNPRIYSF